MKIHDVAFAKVNYSEPINYIPPSLNHEPFKLTNKTKQLVQTKERQESYFNSQFNNLIKPNQHWASEDIGIRIETLFSDRVKKLCNGIVCLYLFSFN